MRECSDQLFPPELSEYYFVVTAIAVKILPWVIISFYKIRKSLVVVPERKTMVSVTSNDNLCSAYLAILLRNWVIGCLSELPLNRANHISMIRSVLSHTYSYDTLISKQNTSFNITYNIVMKRPRNITVKYQPATLRLFFQSKVNS